MKNLITILTVALTLSFTATSTKAGSEEVCGRIAETVAAMAKARDAGLSAEDAYYILVKEGVEEGSAIQLLEIVYLNGADFEPAELEILSFTLCVSDDA